MTRKPTKHKPRVIRPNSKPSRKPWAISFLVIGTLYAAAFATHDQAPAPQRETRPAAAPTVPGPSRQDREELDTLFAKLMEEDKAERAILVKPSTNIVKQAAREAGIDPSLLEALIQAENSGRFTPDVSPKGAIGPAQLMPATARELGVDPRDPHQNVRGGARYLRKHIDRYGNPTLALIAYNWGPGNTDRWLARGGHWSKLPKETSDYISKVSVHAALAER